MWGRAATAPSKRRGARGTRLDALRPIDLGGHPGGGTGQTESRDPGRSPHRPRRPPPRSTPARTSGGLGIGPGGPGKRMNAGVEGDFLERGKHWASSGRFRDGPVAVTVRLSAAALVDKRAWGLGKKSRPTPTRRGRILGLRSCAQLTFRASGIDRRPVSARRVYVPPGVGVVGQRPVLRRWECSSPGWMGRARSTTRTFSVSPSAAARQLAAPCGGRPLRCKGVPLRPAGAERRRLPPGRPPRLLGPRGPRGEESGSTLTTAEIRNQDSGPRSFAVVRRPLCGFLVSPAPLTRPAANPPGGREGGLAFSRGRMASEVPLDEPPRQPRPTWRSEDVGGQSQWIPAFTPGGKEGRTGEYFGRSFFSTT